MSEAIAAVIAKLEAVDPHRIGRDYFYWRDLTAEMALALGWHEVDAPDLANSDQHVLGKPMPKEWIDPADGQSENAPPGWISSIDAALTLIPPGWTRAVDATAPSAGIDVELFSPTPNMKHSHDVRGTHERESIATCIAALRARLASGASDDA